MKALLVLVVMALLAVPAEAGPLKRLKARRQTCATPTLAVAPVALSAPVSDCPNGKCNVQAGRRTGWFGR